MIDLNLGIIYKKGRIIGHRSLLKLVVNPFLRCIGLQVATKIKNGKLGIPILSKCSRVHFNTAWSYPSEGCFIEKRRRLI